MTLATDGDVFSTLVEPLRGELTAHCYRMLGSVHDAEDLVQETFIRAWRSYDKFEGRSSVRTWMYKIATNVCLTALDGRARRPMPTGLGQPASDPRGTLESRPEVTWLEPLPDAVIWGGSPEDPEAATLDHESVRLAFVAALQHLTPPQRAAVVLFDVLSMSASEVAELLGTTVAAVNSSLQRARAHLAKLDPESERDSARQPDDERKRELLAQYVDAFERYDVERIVALLSADAVWEMPPFTGWYSGAEEIGDLIRLNCPAERAGDQILVETTANGGPAFALYMRDPADGVHRAFHLQVPVLGEGGFTHVSAFFDTSLFARFGLPEELPEEHRGRAQALRAGSGETSHG
ncbi:RNA polymerase, sigma subunit, ECF family [Microlunatus sagamiharensis]|uniref:RNA polymerase, sigma subunit, ECF family n=1 Tax=Microlunatus sagamiharensis TaxID=546874 RepID=A0A1H2MWJ9_9ACTN|nr:sigma-70 family RNA polymerase sigma factor [Microlunatus sagamiharensis]SDU97647.1 RNA polymerase, sigma subunit, ECF family [Microlunatus sagamiharensis]